MPWPPVPGKPCITSHPMPCRANSCCSIIVCWVPVWDRAPARALPARRRTARRRRLRYNSTPVPRPVAAGTSFGPSTMSGMKLYLRLLRYVRPYYLVFVAAVLALGLVAAADTLMVWLTAPLINNFAEPDPLWTRWLPVAIVGVFLARSVGAYVSDFGMAWVGHRVAYDLRAAMASL